MAAAGVSSTGCEKLSDRCFLICPDLYDRATRLSWGLKLSMVLLHVIFVGVVFVFDFSLIRRTREEPCYVIDAMRAANGTSTTFNNLSSILKQSNSRDGYIICSMNNHHLEAQTTYFNSSSWLNLVMGLYPPGSAIRNWTCSCCNIVQPPRAKHCHDCDKCILQFDHHCVWLGTCVGQGNHCSFRWYIFLETILCIWTVVLYISYLRSEIEKTWWKDFIAVVLLAVLMFCLIFLIMLLLFHRLLMRWREDDAYCTSGEFRLRFIHLAGASAKTRTLFVALVTACVIWKLYQLWRTSKLAQDLTLLKG